MFKKFFTYQTSFPLLIISLLLSWTSVAQDLPEIPEFQTSVYDNAHMMDALQQKKLEQKLINYADSTSTQIVVVTIKSLGEKNINLYAAEWAHKWGIGQAGKDNGVLFLIAKDDRKMAIQVGYGLEPLLTDAISRRIIELVVAPYFRQGNYYMGIDAGTTAMMDVLSGNFTNDEKEEEPEMYENFFPSILIIIIFFIIVIILIKSGHNSGGSGSYRSSGPVIYSGGSGGFSSGGFGGGGGSFGGGGGGFSGGFGGGGFGGGGASGGW